MSETLGTDAGNLTGQGGAISNTAGDALLGTDNDGSQSYALGPSLSRAISTGVINGDFGTPPPELTTNIDNAENALPYFTTEVSHTDATAPYVQAVDDATAASGQVLRFTIPSGAAIGRYARIVRYVAVPGSAARTWTNQPRAAWRNATGTTKTQAIVTIRSQYYESDGTTTTGTEGSNSATFATIFASTYAYETQANPEGTGAIPTDGAYLRVEVGVQVSVLTTSEMTVDLTEVRIDRGNIQYLVTDQSQPELYGPAAVYLFQGTLFLSNGGIVGSEPRITLSANSGDIALTATGQGDTITLTSATRAASTVTIVTTRAHGLATGYEVIVAGITGAAGATMNGTIYPITVTNSTTFTYTSAGTAGTGTIASATVKSGPGSGIIYLKPAATTTGRVQVDGPTSIDGATSITGNLSGTGTITATSHITGDRIYPGNQATRYIEDNGTYLRARNDFWAVGSLFQSASGISVPVIRVGEAAAAATSIPANGSLTVTVTFPALPTTPNFAVLGIRWAGADANATVVVSGFTSTTVVTARLYNQTATAITSSRAINYVVGAEN